MEGSLRVGVIGVGGMGARHAENLLTRVPRTCLSAVMDPDTDRAEAVARAASARVFESAEELIHSDVVDAIVVASPEHTHAALARACLSARKPALIEKPLATTLEDAEAVVEQEAGLGHRLLQVGLMRRFDSQHLAVAEELATGTVGRPRLLRGWHRNPPEATPPSVLDTLVNAAVHDLDVARWLLGQEIESIAVQGTSVHRDPAVDWDLQLITLTMGDGALAVLEVNKDSGFGYEVGVEVSGPGGMVTTPPHGSALVRRRGRLEQAVEPDWLGRFAQAYVDEVLAWADAALRGSAVGASAWDGARSLAAALAGFASIEAGQPVQVDLPGRPPIYTAG